MFLRPSGSDASTGVSHAGNEQASRPGRNRGCVSGGREACGGPKDRCAATAGRDGAPPDELAAFQERVEQRESKLSERNEDGHSPATHREPQQRTCCSGRASAWGEAPGPKSTAAETKGTDCPTPRFHPPSPPLPGLRLLTRRPLKPIPRA